MKRNISFLLVLMACVGIAMGAEPVQIGLVFSYDSDIKGQTRTDLERVVELALDYANNRAQGLGTIRAGSAAFTVQTSVSDYPERFDFNLVLPWRSVPYTYVSLPRSSAIPDYELGSYFLSLIIEATAGKEILKPDLVFLDRAESQAYGRYMGLSPLVVPDLAFQMDGSLQITGGVLSMRVSPLLEARSVLVSYEDLPNPNYNFFGAKATRGGTLHVKSQGSMVKFPDGSTAVETVSLPSADAAMAGVFSDGSLLLADVTAGTMWIMQQGQSRKVAFQGLNPKDLGYVGVFIDELDTVWFFFPSRGMVFQYSPSGKCLQVISLVVPGVMTASMAGLDPYTFVVRPDGTFLVFSMNHELLCFDQRGGLKWKTSIETPWGSLSLTGYRLAFDPATGRLLVSSNLNPSLNVLVDMDYRARMKLPSLEEDDGRWLPNLWRDYKAATDAGKMEVLRKRALAYDKGGNAEMTWQAWKDCLDRDPANAELKKKLKDADSAIMLKSVNWKQDKVKRLVNEFGPATASTGYYQTMKSYEQLAAAQPENKEIRLAMRDFAKFYRDADILNQDVSQLDLEDKAVANVFPALMQSYRTDPLGFVEVRNSGKAALENVRASVFIKRFMDFPNEGKAVASLGAGKAAKLDLMALFNTEVLDLQEDLQVQAEVSILYRSNKEEHRNTFYLPVRVYKRSALTWDRSAKLASFITPNEQVVAGFAQLVLAGQKGYVTPALPHKLREAMAIADALGQYGLEYLEDPVSPITKSLGASEQVDSVRFPRQTLQLKGGDCDDTTALLASLYESVNLESAIMTTPGHVFMAFNTTEPADRAWLFTRGKLKPVIHEGTVWLPIETTILHKGFAESVRSAMELASRYQADQVEFIPVKSVRALYPPVPLGLSSVAVVEPPAREVQNRMVASGKELEKEWYQPSLEELNGKLASAKGIAAVRVHNQIGVLHGTFGQVDTALAWFKKGMETYQSNAVITANYATLLMNRNRPAEARQALDQGLAVKKDSLPLNYLMARLLAVQGQKTEGQAYYKTALALSKDAVADLSAYYEAGAASGSRAGVDTLKPLGLFE